MDKEQVSQATRNSTDVAQVFDRGLILASSSPRRAEILRTVGWPFQVKSVDIDETIIEGEDAVSYVKRLAAAKAGAVSATVKPSLVLGADTTVVVGGEICGKPVDAIDARRMLRLLSGRWHEVLTGVALAREGENPLLKVEVESTRVQFAHLSTSEIDWLVEFGDPLDKAGAYAVQGAAGMFIDRIEGDYWNIVGLPVQLIYRMAKSLQR